MAACIAALLAGSLILYQEAWVLGLDKAIQYHTKRYGNRSGSESLSIFLVLFKSLARWLAQGYTGAILILFVTGIAYFRRKIPILTTIAPYKLFFTLLLLPSLAHHLLLRQFTIEHEFSTLIDGLALSFLLGLLITRLIQRESFSFSLKIAVIVLVFAINMTMFFLQHLPGKKSIRSYPYDVAYKIGTTISQRAQPEEAVFITNYHREYDIQMIWYARRNLIYCNGPEEAQIILSKMNVKRGVIFQLDSQYMYNGKIDTVFIIKKAAE